MACDVGTRLGPYEIVAPIGAGGMGEVYRARDTRLDRVVAIKVLTGALAADAESRQRFEQEARAIAALNDPHICTIHDVGREGDLEYLVLEYLEGQTLAERIRSGGALPVDAALAIAIQVGDALDRAHRAGIVHRDLKPANVMLVRRAGKAGAFDVKLLDFGLAARTAAARPHGLDASLAATMAPSMVATTPPTAAASSGFSGTVQYMAPEQLDGGEGDQRSDIFAFGCLLYEMLAGRRAFEGASAITAIAAIMGSEPPPVPALASAHPLIDHLMRRCLEKDPDRRWQSIGDVTGELRWVSSQPAPVAAAAATAPRRRFGIWQAMAILLILTALPFAMLAALRLVGEEKDDSGELPALTLELTTPPTDDATGAISPDGQTVAFVANKDGVPMLWVRPLDSVESRPLPGTNGANLPFWSPDNRSIGFFADDKLKRVDVDGGALLVVTSAPTARGGAWGPDGVLLFAPGVSAPIRKVSARGGAVEDVTAVNAATGPSHRRPQFLPDGRHFLFSSVLGGPATNGVYFASLDGTPPVRIVPDDGLGVFAPPDHLLTLHQNTLLAYVFNPASGKVQGEPVTVAQTSGLFGASSTGVLAYRTGSAQRRQLTWVDRHGTVLRTVGDPRTDGIASPELSPDEQRVAVFLHPGAGEDNDVWTIELARNLAHPITTGPPADAHPLWDPDGQHVIFTSRRGGVAGPTRFPIGGGQPEPVLPKDNDAVTSLSMTRDRRFILMRRANNTTGVDLVAASLPDGKEIVVTEATGDETEGQFSPDSRWVAFVGNESGRAEVFVQSFPDRQGRTQVSLNGGAQVRWSADGRELYYVAPDGKLMAVSIEVRGAAFEVKAPVTLFQTHLANGNNVVGNKAQYAVSRDGRFLLNAVVEGAAAPIIVMVNWPKKLAARP